MRLHQRGELPFGNLVETGRRFVEQPDRPVAHEKPGNGRAAALAGGKIAEGQMTDIEEADHFQRLADRQVIFAEKILPEGKILLHRQRWLHGVAVAEIMARARGVLPFLATLEGNLPFRHGKQAGNHSEQRRLANSVRTRNDQTFAGGKGEIHAREDQLAAAFPAQIFGR